MNFKAFFELAKKKGITECQIFFSKSKSTKISLFHSEIDTYTISDTQSISALGIYKGKLGAGNTQKMGKDAFEFLVDQIILTATYREKEDKVGLYKGADHYVKRRTYNKELPLIPIEKKIEDLFALEKAIYAYDPRITDADNVTYTESESSSILENSHGLRLNSKSNYYYFLGGAVARDKEETKTYYDIHFDDDYKTFDVDRLTKKICDSALKKFGGAPCDSGKYPTVLHRDIAASLVGYFLSNVIADKVQRHSSFFEGKLHTKVASSKLTIEEKPLANTLFFSSFDDEGVPCRNKVIVKNGVLETFLYNRETAEKDGVETTANGSWGGSKWSTTIGPIFVKGGKKSFEEMIAPIKRGVYITEIAGLGTGMNASSGDFSCQAEGYMIEEGKLTSPLNLITLSGNLFKMFNEIKEFDNNCKMNDSGTAIGDLYIKSLNIGGK
ncbi:MAG: TldD/PmbA family protein [Bacilli bacterium]|nr:TldD/PmbA family protein [Bacilli bacterium]